ncbi:hypothetical protein ROSMUCSMR3_03584 [Roseovarius mucosus]|uniref:Uncharacterized protein n=1 Tax=Roseovarius mucosus TaxID=215743 RepID=A0A1V0RTD1_9RHOB|nr:hypothetical protein [Roseovarius mucosus]ARE85038.1 hypothetical protein ROSMUCSMR3_03584 [Roseovarius mucosus]
MSRDPESLAFNSLHDEFVLIGPVGKRDQVLARSEAAGMDLIGYAMDKDDTEDEVGGSLLSFMLLGPRRQLHRVSSWPVSNSKPEEDERKASYRFAWVGYCSRSDLRSIEKSFNANIYDISEAVSAEDRSQMELALAPILLRCSRANDRVQRKRRLTYVFLAAYAAIGFVGLAGVAIQDYLQTFFP